METGTFYPDRYHIPVCLLLVFCKLHNWSAWSFFIWQIPNRGNCLLLPVTGYAHVNAIINVYYYFWTFSTCGDIVDLSAMLRIRAKPPLSPSHSDAEEFPSSFVECNRRMLERQDGCDVTFVVKGIRTYWILFRQIFVPNDSTTCTVYRSQI